MSTAILPQFSYANFYPGNPMNTSNQDAFTNSSMKRCSMIDEYVNEAIPQLYGGSAPHPEMAGGDNMEVPDQLITLSYDLLHQIQQHEQDCTTGEDMTVSDITSQIGASYKSVQSASVDSSSYKYGFTDMYSDVTEDQTSLSPMSSPSESLVYSPDSPCDSVQSKNKISGVTKPLYTAELEVLCRICGDRASGYHYGVHSCEGCKGFFRRTLKKDLVYKPCRESSQCRIDTGTRNKCQYCRYQKCLNAGMSQNAVRFGRMPKVEREKLIADKEELSKNTTSRIMELRSLSDCIKGAFMDCFSQCSFISYYLQHNMKQASQIKIDPDYRFSSDTLTAQKFSEQNLFKCFQDTIIPVIEGTVKFTKKIPTFSNLGMVDRITLLKQNCFCVPLILSYLMWDNSSLLLDSQSSLMSIVEGQGPFHCCEAQGLFEGMFSVASKLTAMQLKIVEVALFAASVLLIESPGLTEYSDVEGLQMELLNSLRLELKHNHPKDRYLFPRLLVLIPQLVQVTEEFRTNLKQRLFDNSPDLSKTHALLVELFDLR